MIARAGRWVGGAFVVASFVFWVWAFSPWARSENPARLDDRDFVAWAEQRCSETQDTVNALPTAREAQSRPARAAQVDSGTALVETLLADLRQRSESQTLQASTTSQSNPSGPSDSELLDAWFADWDRYIEDRYRHSQRLRDASADTPDRELRFLLVEVTEGSTYTERMDGFARLNNMDSCQIPGDV